MKKEDFILRAATFFFTDNVEESLELLTKAKSDECSIEGVSYSEMCESYPAVFILAEIYRLANILSEIHFEGQKDGYKRLQDNALDVLKRKRDERKKTESSKEN